MQTTKVEILIFTEIPIGMSFHVLDTFLYCRTLLLKYKKNNSDGKIYPLYLK